MITKDIILDILKATAAIMFFTLSSVVYLACISQEQDSTKNIASSSIMYDQLDPGCDMDLGMYAPY